MRSGVPNTTKCLAAPFPCLGQDFGCVSWNARGLFCVDPILRDAKILELHSLCRKFCIVCLQETHGTEVSALLQSSGILRSHVFLPSGFMRDGQFCGDAGGVGILVDKGLFLKSDDGSLLPLSSTPVVIALNLVKVHVPGRCMSIRVWDSRGAKSCVVYNTHNFGLSGMEMSRIERALMTDMATIRIDMTNSSLILNGDFNLHPADEPKIKVDCPEVLGSFTCPTGPLANRWYKMFDMMVEIKFPLPNHFCSANNTLNKLTRMFLFVGRSVLPLLAHQAGVLKDPIFFHARGLSDHAPSFWKFSTRLKPKGKVQCLQHQWCRHPAYRKRMDDLCHATNLSSLPVESRSVLLKTFIREASLHARDCMFEDLPNGHTSRLLRLSSIARVVWQKDLKLYNLYN